MAAAAVDELKTAACRNLAFRVSDFGEAAINTDIRLNVSSCRSQAESCQSAAGPMPAT